MALDFIEIQLSHNSTCTYLTFPDISVTKASINPCNHELYIQMLLIYSPHFLLGLLQLQHRSLRVMGAQVAFSKNDLHYDFS